MFSFYILVYNLIKKKKKRKDSESCRLACDICNESDAELTLYNV